MHEALGSTPTPHNLDMMPYDTFSPSTREVEAGESELSKENQV